MSIASKNKERQKRIKYFGSLLMNYKGRVDRGDLDINNYDFTIFEEKEKENMIYIRRYIKTKIKPIGFDI